MRVESIGAQGKCLRGVDARQNARQGPEGPGSHRERAAGCVFEAAGDGTQDQGRPAVMDRGNKYRKMLGVLVMLGALLLWGLAGCSSQPERVYKVAYAAPPTAEGSGWVASPYPGGGSPSQGYPAGPSMMPGHPAGPMRPSGEGAGQGPAWPGSPYRSSLPDGRGQGAVDTYHVGPGDLLEIRVDQLLDPEKEAVVMQVVDPQGQVFMPLLRHVPVAGKTCDQIRNDLVLRLGESYLRDPKVNVAVKEHGSKRVAVLGAVGRPGTVALRTDRASLVDVLSEVGGIQPNAAPTIEILRGAYGWGEESALEPASYGGGNRGGVRREVVPTSRVFAEGPERVDPVIYPGDVVQIAEGSEGYVYLAGAVAKPGAQQFRRPLNLLQAISVAGGATRVAKEKECKLIRRTPEGQEQVVILDLEQIRKGEAANPQLAMNDTVVLPNDPVKQFFAEVDNFFRRGVFAGVEVTYDAGSQMGWPRAGRY